MSDPEIKVTDRRMFDPDGRLRKGYEHLEGAESPETKATEPSPPPAESGSVQAARAGGDQRTEQEEPRPRPAEEGPRLEIPGSPPELDAPTFFDLVSVLAEPVVIYLGEARMPDGSTSENLEMARLYIDLLDLLRQRTAGRLAPDEATFLEDLLYQLRMRYVQKRG